MKCAIKAKEELHKYLSLNKPEHKKRRRRNTSASRGRLYENADRFSSYLYQGSVTLRGERQQEPRSLSQCQTWISFVRVSCFLNEWQTSLPLDGLRDDCLITGFILSYFVPLVDPWLLSLSCSFLMSVCNKQSSLHLSTYSLGSNNGIIHSEHAVARRYGRLLERLSGRCNCAHFLFCWAG